MSLHGSGRFSRRRDSDVNSSGGSIHSNFSAVHQQPSYEPGTGAAFMAQSGWHNRDAYGRPRTVTTTTHTVGLGTGLMGTQTYGGGQRTAANLPPHSVKFSQSPDYKTIYMIALIVVSILLVGLILLIIILFATKVFIMNSAPAVPLSNPATPSPPLSSHPPPPIEPSAPPAPSMPPHQPLYPNLGAQSTTYGEKLQTRSFECEFYILEQANTAYNNTDSFEYNQAIQIIQSALATMLDGSSLRDLSSSVTVDRIENGENDLRVVFHISIMVPAQSSIHADSMKGVLMTESVVLESLLNHTKLDQTRITVRQTHISNNA
ncbi:hypothetical protein Ddc_03646 [Ditylenchus destructor]|nr:hypothetical protein Ddc_03646 [Ditylenchus destructor]